MKAVHVRRSPKRVFRRSTCIDCDRKTKGSGQRCKPCARLALQGNGFSYLHLTTTAATPQARCIACRVVVPDTTAERERHAKSCARAAYEPFTPRKSAA